MPLKGPPMVESLGEISLPLDASPCPLPSTATAQINHVHQLHFESFPVTVLGSPPPTLEKIGKALGAGVIGKVVLMTGAGISVNAGIPDFRSADTGLFSKLREQNNMGSDSPEQLFNITYFKRNPAAFYALARELFPGNTHPTDAHFFSVLLQRKGLLLRHYTQNIDNLEVLAGVSPAKLVEAHGSFSDAHCIRCRRRCPIGWLRKRLMADGTVRRCRSPRPLWLLNEDVDRERLSREEFAEELRARIKNVIPFKRRLNANGTSEVQQSGPACTTKSSNECHLSAPLERMGIEDPPKVVVGSMETKTAAIEFTSHRDDCSGCEAGPQLDINQPTGTAVHPTATLDGSKPSSDGDCLAPPTNLTKKKIPRCDGLFKPDIVFYGEVLPHRFVNLYRGDFAAAELLIVLGTSLQVFPFAALIGEVNRRCPRLLINREVAGEDDFPSDRRFAFSAPNNYRDVHFMGDCDDGVRQLCRLAGWLEELDAVKAEYHKNVEADNWRLLEQIQPALSSAKLREGKFFSDEDDLSDDDADDEGLHRDPSGADGYSDY